MLLTWLVAFSFVMLGGPVLGAALHERRTAAAEKAAAEETTAEETTGEEVAAGNPASP